MRRIMLSILFITIFLICTNYVSAFDLRPDLASGVYNIVRAVEIDPDRVWINYGQEIIGRVHVLEKNNKPGINLKRNLENFVTNDQSINIDNIGAKDSGMKSVTGATIKETIVMNNGFFVGVGISLLVMIFLMNIIYLMMKKSRYK